MFIFILSYLIYELFVLLVYFSIKNACKRDYSYNQKYLFSTNQTQTVLLLYLKGLIDEFEDFM